MDWHHHSCDFGLCFLGKRIYGRVASHVDQCRYFSGYLLPPACTVGLYLQAIAHDGSWRFGGRFDISEVLFKRLMAIIIIGSVILMFVSENRKSTKVPNSKLFSWIAGFLTGFTTMIGNLAGPVSNLYFLTMRFPKNEFIGTAAWLFFIINLFKLPFHFFIWKTVTVESLVLNSVLVPIVILGFFMGVSIVKLISNVNYRRFILVVTAIGGIILLLDIPVILTPHSGHIDPPVDFGHKR